MSSRNHSTRFSDSQRRTICRLAFVLCAIVPTLFAIRQVFSPSSSGGMETALRAATGIVATVESVNTPRPGFYTLQSVQLPVSGGQQLMLGAVHVATGNNCQIEIPETVRVDCTDLTSLVQQFCDAALPTTLAGLKSSTPVFLRCRRLVVSDREFPDDPARQLILSPLEFHFAADPERSIVLIRFHVAGGTTTTPVEIKIDQPVNSPAGVHQVHVATGDTMMPVWLAKAIWPDAEKLLPAGLFSGQVDVAVDEAGKLNGTVYGSVIQAELQELFAGTSLDMTGTAQLVNVECLLESSRIRSFNTVLSAESGLIGHSALETMSELGWQVRPPVAAMPTVPYRHFQLECKFENGRVEFWPRLKNEPVMAWNDENQAVVTTRYLQTFAPIELMARRLFQSPGSSPASVATLDDRAVGFLSRFNLAPGTVDAEAVEVRTAESDRTSTDRF